MSENNKFEPTWGYVWGLRALIGFTTVALIAIWFIGMFLDGITDRPGFITVNSLALLLFVTSVISLFTSRETAAIGRQQAQEAELQRKAAEGQLKAMNDALTEMQGQREQMTFQTAQTSSQSILMRDQVTQMIGQGETMQGQLKSMEEARDQAERIFYLSERAYLYLKSGSFKSGEIKPNERNQINLEVCNGGRTPAFNVRIEANQAICTVDPELAEPGMMARLEQSRSVSSLLVSGQKYLYTWTPNSLLDAADFTMWQKDKSRLYFLTRITYEDIHADTQSLSYLYEYTRNGKFLIKRPIVLEVRKRKKQAKSKE